MSFHTQTVSFQVERHFPAVLFHRATRTQIEAETFSNQFSQRQHVVTYLSNSECGLCLNGMLATCRSTNLGTVFRPEIAISFCCTSLSLRVLRSRLVGIKSANFGVHKCSSLPLSRRREPVDPAAAHMLVRAKHQPVDVSSSPVRITTSSTSITAATSPSSAETAAAPPFDLASAMRFLQSTRLCPHLSQYPQYPWNCSGLDNGF